MNQTPDTGRAPQAGAVMEISLRPGTTVEVLNMENRLIFVGKADTVSNGAVVLRDAKGNDLPSVLYNTEVKLRFFRDRDSLVLHGKVCGSTDQIWKVDRLESKFVKEQRAFFRQRISTNTEALCARRPAVGGTAKKPVPCQILDVSAGGLLLLCREVYQVNDRLLVTGIFLTKTMDPFSFNCQVRRVGKLESSGMTRYGCQFEALPSKEQDRLLRAIFMVQREEIKSQKDL